MTNLELQMLLEEAYGRTFLDKILFLKENEREYNRSDFYKTTKIPLLQLYKEFSAYYSSEYAIADKINEFINNLEIEQIVQKGVDILEGFLDSEKLQEFLEKLSKDFDFKKILDQNEELQKMLNQIKKG